MININDLIKILDGFSPYKIGIKGHKDNTIFYSIGNNLKNELFAWILVDLKFESNYLEVYYKDFIQALSKKQLKSLLLTDDNLIVNDSNVPIIGSVFKQKENIDNIISENINNFILFEYINGYNYNIFNSFLNKKNDLIHNDICIPFGLLDIGNDYYFFATDKYVIALMKYSSEYLSVQGDLDLSDVELIRFPSFVRRFINPSNMLMITDFNEYGVYGINDDIVIFTNTSFLKKEVENFSYKDFSRQALDYEINLTIKIKNAKELLKTMEKIEEDLIFSIKDKKIKIGSNIDFLYDVTDCVQVITKDKYKSKETNVIIPLKNKKIEKILSSNKATEYIHCNFYNKTVYITDNENIKKSMYVYIMKESS